MKITHNGRNLIIEGTEEELTELAGELIRNRKNGLVTVYGVQQEERSKEDEEPCVNRNQATWFELGCWLANGLGLLYLDGRAYTALHCVPVSNLDEPVPSRARIRVWEDSLLHPVTKEFILG